MLHSQACDALIVRTKIRNAQRRKLQVMNFFKECCPNATRREQAICCAFSHDRGGTTDAELRLASGLALMGKFDGEVGSGKQARSERQADVPGHGARPAAFRDFHQQ